ncbi:MAG: GNAT family protein [Hyphomonas sp.]|uniref:GNAT family N-acetyltransferase n=1 Tax=Hyphomonas sp. TaxID=87 RepID=UPI0035276877
MDLAAAELADRHVTLVPFDVSRDGSALRAMAEALGERIATWPYYAPPADWIGYWLGEIERRTGDGFLIPFRVQHPDGRFAGITTYLGPDRQSKNVEIGMTMYAADAQGTAINPAAKRLMLGNAFDAGAVRVQFNIDQRNLRSQAAVKKLGAVKEGVLRDNRVVASGYLRSTVIFSILAAEWPAVKARLDARLAEFD